MDELQNVRKSLFSYKKKRVSGLTILQKLGALDNSDQQGISHVWSLFSAAPAKQRKLMLQGILTVCCFPQLSFISASIRDLIKIDFLSVLPNELSFKILSCLDTVSLCKAAQVSRRWNELAEDDVVWHRMCEQHIARKCKKCGWGLPLLDRKRLLMEKKLMERRANGLQTTESAVESREASETPCDHPITGEKRALEEDVEAPPAITKRPRIDSHESSAQVVHSKNAKKPWKEVYKARFKVGTNWKYGRHTLKVLKGHTNGVMCLQFHDNILATGSYDATIKIWDLDTSQEIRTLEGHTSGVRCLQFDQNQLISGGMDHKIKMWNWRTGDCIRTLDGPTNDVLSVNFASNYLACGGKDNMVRIWATKNRSTFTLRGHRDFVNAVSLDIPSRTVFSASDDCTVRLWDLDSRQVIKTFVGHVGGVQQLFLLPPEFELDEAELLDCQHDSDTEPDQEEESSIGGCGLPPRAVDAITAEHTASPVPANIQNLSLFPDQPDRPNPPTYILTASLDSTIRLWHVPSGRCLRTLFGHLEGIWALTADNLRVVSGAEDRMLKVWDPRTGKCERTFTGHAGPVTCVGLSGERLITGSEDCEIRVMEFGPGYD
jgi:F-box/WD-40 domain protein MET30